MLGLGYLYPVDRIRGALAAVMKHNFRENFGGFKQVRGDISRRRRRAADVHLAAQRPAEALHRLRRRGVDRHRVCRRRAMLYEDMLGPARRIVKMARSRYDGRRRDGLNSGPGGNPYNELECGKFYARAMSSWSLLIACQGLVLEGPRDAGLQAEMAAGGPSHVLHSGGRLGAVRPATCVRPPDRADRGPARPAAAEGVSVRVGRDTALPTATVTVASRPVRATPRRDGTEVRLALEGEVTVAEGETVRSCSPADPTSRVDGEV